MLHSASKPAKPHANVCCRRFLPSAQRALSAIDLVGPTECLRNLLTTVIAWLALTPTSRCLYILGIILVAESAYYVATCVFWTAAALHFRHMVSFERVSGWENR